MMVSEWQACRRGYQVHLCYVGVNSADIALERIAHRVAVGGMASIMMRCDGPKMDGPWLVDAMADEGWRCDR